MAAVSHTRGHGWFLDFPASQAKVCVGELTVGSLLSVPERCPHRQADGGPSQTSGCCFCFFTIVFYSIYLSLLSGVPRWLVNTVLEIKADFPRSLSIPIKIIWMDCSDSAYRLFSLDDSSFGGLFRVFPYD